MIQSVLLKSMAILHSSTSYISLAPAVRPPIRQRRWGAGLCTEGRRMHPCALSPCQSWFRSWCPERRRNVNLTEEMGRRLVCGGGVACDLRRSLPSHRASSSMVVLRATKPPCPCAGDAWGQLPNIKLHPLLVCLSWSWPSFPERQRNVKPQKMTTAQQRPVTTHWRAQSSSFWLPTS